MSGQRDTIFALASGAGRAGVAVIRLSGPQAGGAMVSLTGNILPPPRHARYAALRRYDGETIDRGIVLWFPAPRSLTGEDVGELHVHGGRAVIASLVETLNRCPGLRPAEPGEFSRRAFENAKMDLTAAEGLADLVAAETEAQRRQALRQMGGALARLYDGWRHELTAILAHLEAEIDFPDEDLPGGIGSQVAARAAALLAALRGHLGDNRRGERLRDGVSVAILGPPNVGKSSLLNNLARRDAAIVSAVAGTTRDVIEVHLDLDGLPVVVADTAGIRPTEDEIEREGVRRAMARADQADIKLVMLDATAWPDVGPQTLQLIDGDSLVILNKIDLKPLNGAVTIAGQRATLLSLATGAGLSELLERLRLTVEHRLAGASDAVITRSRHRSALTECVAALERFVANGSSAELGAEDVRLAARALGRITGRIGVEDVLDVVFREFCIGK